MCHFLSFNLIDGATPRVFAAPSLRSHADAETHHDLKPNSYRECEWLKDDDGASLNIRVASNDEHDENWYKSAVLSSWATRQNLIDYLLVLFGFHAGGEVVDGLDLRGTQITTLPDGLKVGGSLYLRGTQITTLPDGLKVGGYLDLRGTQITTLPDGLKVGGSLDLRGTQIKITDDLWKKYDIIN